MQIDESFLLRTFGRFGPIASVKIMWPRSDDEKRRARNSGFVAFMKRKDAEAAKDEMSGEVAPQCESLVRLRKQLTGPPVLGPACLPARPALLPGTRLLRTPLMPGLAPARRRPGV